MSVNTSPLLGLDPMKEKKLEERLSRAPGSITQIGFEDNNSTSIQGPWEENSRGKEASAKQKEINEV